MNVYVAGPVHSALSGKYRDTCRAIVSNGHSITHDWSASTHLVDKGAVSAFVGDVVRGQRHAASAALAENDMRGVLAADAVVMMASGYRGTHVELGLALGHGIPVLLVVEDPSDLVQNGYHCVFHHASGVDTVHIEGENENEDAAVVEILKWLSKVRARPAGADGVSVRRIQAQAAYWQRKNFDDVASELLALGLAEEVGEIAHAVLKRKQGIRGTKAEHDAAIADGVGDLLIYLLNFCTSEGLLLDEVLLTTWTEVSQRDWRAYPVVGNG